MPHVTENDEANSDDLEGDLITQDELAAAVADDMGSGSPVVRALWDDLLRGEHAAAVMAEAEMRRVIEFNKQVDHRFQEGMGQLVARIPMSVFMHWTAVYGHEFWNQPDSLEFLAKRAGGGRGNPGLLIETKGRATMIVDRKVGSRVSPVSGTGGSGESGKTAAGAQTIAPAARPDVPRGKRSRGGRWAA